MSIGTCGGLATHVFLGGAYSKSLVAMDAADCFNTGCCRCYNIFQQWHCFDGNLPLWTLKSLPGWRRPSKPLLRAKDDTECKFTKFFKIVEGYSNSCPRCIHRLRQRLSLPRLISAIAGFNLCYCLLLADLLRMCMGTVLHL